MQNKTAVWIFTVLLAIACLYQLSFSLVTASVEADAEQAAQSSLDSLLATGDTALDEVGKAIMLDEFEQDYLQKISSEPVYPVLGFDYAYCRKNEINLGLDLQGGMNVTLQVSVREMIIAMSDGSTDPNFQKAIQLATDRQRESQDDYVTLFEAAWNEVNKDAKLSVVFHNRENKEKFPLDASNEDVLKVIREEADAAVSRTEQVLRRRIDNLGVVQPSIQRQPGTGRIIVELPGIKDKERVRKILQGTAKLEFWETFDNGEIYAAMEQANKVLADKFAATNKKSDDAATGDSADVEVDTSSVSAAADSSVADSATDSDSNSIDALLAGDDSVASDSASLAEQAEEFAENNPLYAVLRPAIYQDPDDGKYYAGKGPTVGYASIFDTAEVNELLARRDVKSLFPRRMKFLWAAKTYDDEGRFLQLFAINVTDNEGKAPLEGDVVTNARVTSSALGSPEISLSMNAEGAKIWKNMTAAASAQATKKSIAIVLDNLVYSAPRVENEIAGGNSSISGQFTLEEAEDLANVLKAGKLPAPARIIEEAVVGPTLGSEAIQSGFMSFLIALLLVLVYMYFYYSSAGILADLALVANLFFILGVLSSLGATLTLPGIAGIVLTIGMSVDANVLIYERVREELKAGKGVKLAIQDGYKNAYSSIIDANLTTLITGIILYIFGTGPIKGFATTLIIGIATSLFSAIFLTRLLFEWRLNSNATPSFSSRFSENLLTNVNINFVGKRKLFYLISGVVIAAGMVSLATRGLNFGVDFTGGRSYIVRFDQTVPVADVAASLSAEFVAENGQKLTPEVKTYGAANQVKVTTKYMVDSELETADASVEEALRAGLDKSGMAYEVMSSQKVGPTIADDIKQAAVLAVLFSLIAIFLYILLRFRKWTFGVGASVALIHDVLMVLSAFSLLYGFLPFSLEIDQAFIAAILTVVGYSINDTVVVFDRIRENLGIQRRKEMTAVINGSLNTTLTRTLNTSFTTLIVLLMIFIFGGEVIRGFVFALIIGIVVGTYSSIFVATPLVIDLTSKKNSEE